MRIVAISVASDSDIPITDKYALDPKIISIMVLFRTLGHLSGALSLLKARLVIEARTITRCCFENMYFVMALESDGESYIEKFLLDNTASTTRMADQLLVHARNYLGPDRVKEVAKFKTQSNAAVPKAENLSPKKMAKAGDGERAYLFYSQLSSDAAHPSMTSLARHLGFNKDDSTIECILTPEMTHEEEVDTLIMLSMSLLCVIISVNNIVGSSKHDEDLNSLWDMFLAMQL